MLPYETLEARARSLLPQAVFDYYAGGSAEESTARGTRDARSLRECLLHGAAGLIVSNHGGRQLAGALATGGANGVRQVLDALREDTAHALALAGASSVSSVGPDLLAPPRRP